MRPIPARCIRTHAGLGASSSSEIPAAAANSSVENVGPAEMPTAVATAPPQAPTSAQPSISVERIPDVSATTAPQVADLPKISVPEGAGQDTLAMQDILPDVKATEVETSVAEKVESMFNKVHCLSTTHRYIGVYF